MIQIDPALWPEASMGAVKASAKAVEKAHETNTKLALWIDGKVVEMTADEWESYQQSQQQLKQEIETHVSR